VGFFFEGFETQPLCAIDIATMKLQKGDRHCNNETAKRELGILRLCLIKYYETLRIMNRPGADVYVQHLNPLHSSPALHSEAGNAIYTKKHLQNLDFYLHFSQNRYVRGRTNKYMVTDKQLLNNA